MEIIVGKKAGFCYGVKRAVESAEIEIKNAKKENLTKLYCLGEIVHNRQVIEKLQRDGMEFIESLEEIAENCATSEISKMTEKEKKIIIRAHGIEKEIYNIAKKKNVKLLDYTCPNVLKIHRLAEEYTKEGYYIFLCGSANHPENIGTISYCREDYSIIERVEDLNKALENFKKSKLTKLLVISQTTYSLEKFHKIEQTLKEQILENIELKIKNTICHATELRQKETEDLAKEVDYIIIVGGKNSSNTQKLYELAEQNCKNTICVETEKDIEEKELDKMRKYEKVGIMAGASTPQKSINDIIDKIKSTEK